MTLKKGARGEELGEGARDWEGKFKLPQEAWALAGEGEQAGAGAWGGSLQKGMLRSVVWLGRETGGDRGSLPSRGMGSSLGSWRGQGRGLSWGGRYKWMKRAWLSEGARLGSTVQAG